jgi:starch synthase
MPVDLNVLLACAEVFPLVKTGGLADVCASLPSALRDFGAEARVIMPAYRGVAEAAAARPVGRPFRPLSGADSVRLMKGHLPGSRVPVYLVHCPALYDRPGNPYGDQHGQDHPDNAIRFGVLSKVAAMFGTREGLDGWRADVVHGHDWHCGLASAYLKFGDHSTAASVFTIHNLAYQGNFNRKVRKSLGIDSLAFHMDGLEFYGHLSFMKAGIFYADAVTTVSPTYAKEIQNSDLGCGMDGVLRFRSDRLTGILNGIDLTEWDPATDRRIPATYSVDEPGGKGKCRAALLKAKALEAGDDGLVVGMLGRMTRQKGWDLILDAAPALLETGTRIILMGSGHKGYEDRIRALRSRYPGRLGHQEGFHEDFAHLLVSGADILAIPSLFEPCGLVQMYAQRYGTLPLAHRTGGLGDSITDLDDVGRGPPTGFLFSPASPDALVTALARADRLRTERPGDWKTLQENGMRRDFSWRASAQMYAEVFQAALDNRRNGTPG